MRSDKNKKGFTLLEMMIASIIGAFIAIVAVSALNTVSAARNKVEGNIEIADELGFAASVMRQDLANFYRDADTANMKLEGTIEGYSENPVTSITFRTVSGSKARSSQPEGDIYEVQYFLSEDQDGPFLARRVCPVVGNEDDAAMTEGGLLVKIARNIQAFTVRYYDGYAWQTEWSVEQSQELPQLIDITLATTTSQSVRNRLMKNFVVVFPRMPSASQQGTQQGGTQQGTQQTGTGQATQTNQTQTGAQNAASQGR